MKRVFAWAMLAILAVVAVAVSGNRVSGAAPATKAEREIRAVLEEQAAAWNRGDIEGFMKGYWKSERTVFAGANGVTHGWQNLLERYCRGYPDRKTMGKLTFSDLEITVLSRDAAVVLGRWQLEREAGPVGGVFTLVARKMPEGWRIVHDHTSTVAPPAK